MQVLHERDIFRFLSNIYDDAWKWTQQWNIFRESFLLDTLKTKLWMENLIHRWIQLGPFFPKSEYFFLFSENCRGVPVAYESSEYESVCLNNAWICLNMSYCPSICLNVAEYCWMSWNLPESAWISWSGNARVLNISYYLK